MEGISKERVSLIIEIIETRASFDIRQMQEILKIDPVLNKVILRLIPKNFIRTIKNNIPTAKTYKDLFSGIDHQFAYDTSIVQSLAEKQINDNKINEYITLYIMNSYVSFYVKNEEGLPIRSSIPLFKLFCTFEPIYYSQTIISCFNLLLHTFIAQATEEEFMEIFPYLSEYLHRNLSFSKWLLSHLIEAINKYSKINGICEKSVAPAIITTLSMVVVDYPAIFDKTLFLRLFSIIEPFIYQMNEFCLSLFQHFYMYLTDDIFLQFVSDLPDKIVDFILSTNPFLKYNKLTPIQIEPPASPASNFTFDDGKTFNDGIDLTEPKLKPESRLLCDEKLFSSFSLLFKVIGSSEVNLDLFLGKFFESIEQKQNSEYYPDLCGLFSLCLLSISPTIKNLSFTLPKLFWDPKLVDDDKKSLESMRFYAIKALIKQQCHFYEVFLAETVLSPLLFTEVINCSIECVSDLCSFINTNPRMIQAFTNNSLALQHSKTISTPEVEMARLALFRLYYRIFQIDGMLRLFLENSLFGPFFLSLLFEHGTKQFALSQIRLHLASFPSEDFFVMLTMAVEQAKIGMQSNKEAYVLLTDITNCINGSVADHMNVYVLCRSYSAVMEAIPEYENNNQSKEGLTSDDIKDIVPNLVEAVTNIFIRVSNVKKLKNVWIDSLFNPMKYMDDEMKELKLAQLICGNFISHVTYNFQIANPYVAKLMIELIPDQACNILKALCEIETNAIALHEASVDSFLLKLIIEKYDRKLIALFCQIAEIASSPVIVQQYLHSFTPIDGRYASPLSKMMLQPLKVLIESAHTQPESWLSLSNEMTFSIDSERCPKNHYAISAWFLVEGHQADLFSFPESSITFAMEDNKLQICGHPVTCLLPRKRWFMLTLVQNEKMSIYIEGTKVDELNVQTYIKTPQLKIGGCQTNSRISNIYMFEHLTGKDISEMYNMGPRSHLFSFQPVFSLTHRTISGINSMAPKSFPNILLRIFKVEILLPLLAQLDLKTVEGNENDLSAVKIFEVISSALLVSNIIEKDFLSSDGPSVIAHLLVSVDKKHITYDLYLGFYNLLKQVQTHELQKAILEEIIFNFTLIHRSEPNQHIRILKHIAFTLYPEFPDNVIEVVPFSKLLDLIRIYYCYQPLEFSLETVHKVNPELNIKECRSILIKMGLLIAQKHFDDNDFSHIISHIVTLPDIQQKLDLLYMIKSLALLHPSPLINLHDSQDTLARLHYIFNTADDATTIAVIEVIIAAHQKVQQNSPRAISLFEHLEIIFHLLAPRDFSPNLLSSLTKLVKDVPEVFKLCSYLSISSGNASLYDEIKPSPKYSCGPGWSFWACVAAIKMDSMKIFDFLVRCNSHDWPVIYGCIDIICRIQKIDRYHYLTMFLTAALTYSLETDVPEQDAVILIKFVFYFLFFHEKPSPNKALDSLFEDMSPTSGSATGDNTDHGNGWTMLFGSNKDVDYLLSKSLRKPHFIFSLRISPPHKWDDIPLASLLLKMIAQYPNKFSIALGIVLISFIVRNDEDFATGWLKLVKGSADITEPLARFRVLHDKQYEFTAFLSLESIVQEIDPAPGIIFLHIHEQIKKLSQDCFELVKEAFTKDQISIVDELVSNVSLLADNHRANKEENAKSWRRLWSNASSSGGPWETNKAKTPFKRDFTLCSFYCPSKLKPNRKFDQHKKASLARDVGNMVTAKEALKEYEEELKQKYLENAPPDILETEGDHENSSANVNDVGKLKLYQFECEMITMKETYPCSFIMYQTAIHITLTEKPKVYIIKYIDIIDILYRRRYHHKTAIEIVTLGGRSYLLNFPKELSQTIVSRLASMEITNAVFVQKIDFKQYFTSQNFTSLWMNREISTFEYLMRLNFFTGRSFNDSSQYPFMPWTIIEFDSPTIDVRNEAIYRDLSKPVGALGEQRLNELITRMEDMMQFSQDAFLYSSFAICPLSLFLWNVRQEPFTSLHIEMQSGKFDHASRLFSSIKDTYKLVTTHLNDYRELIPEFFFSFEFMRNDNCFDLGIRNGQPIEDVILPNWASNTMEFVYIMRKSLESEYVSNHINEWIDLFWGYKQTGPEAVKAHNLFGPNTYEGIWTKENLKDPAKRASIEASMCHVGAMPPKIFDRPHEHRKQVQPRSTLQAMKSIDIPCEFDIAYFRGDSICLIGGKTLNVIDYDVGTMSLTNKRTREFSEEIVESYNGMNITSSRRCLDLPQLNDVSHISSDHGYAAAVTDGATLHMVGPRLNLSVPFFGDGITCTATSQTFSAVVCGTTSQRIVFVNLFEGSKYNSVEIGFTADRVIITQAWGFVIATGSSDHVHYCCVLSINGDIIRKTAIPTHVTAMETWTDRSGFDFFVAGFDDGKVISGEAFYGIANPPQRCYSRVVAVSYVDDPQCVAAITSSGKLFFFPLNT